MTTLQRACMRIAILWVALNTDNIDVDLLYTNTESECYPVYHWCCYNRVLHVFIICECGMLMFYVASVCPSVRNCWTHWLESSSLVRGRISSESPSHISMSRSSGQGQGRRSNKSVSVCRKPWRSEAAEFWQTLIYVHNILQWNYRWWWRTYSGWSRDRPRVTEQKCSWVVCFRLKGNLVLIQSVFAFVFCAFSLVLWNFVVSIRSITGTNAALINNRSPSTNACDCSSVDRSTLIQLVNLCDWSVIMCSVPRATRLLSAFAFCSVSFARCRQLLFARVHVDVSLAGLAAHVATPLELAVTSLGGTWPLDVVAPPTAHDATPLRTGRRALTSPTGSTQGTCRWICLQRQKHRRFKRIEN